MSGPFRFSPRAGVCTGDISSRGFSPALETDTCIRATMRVEELRECVMLDRVTEGGGRIYRRERGGGKRSSSIGFRCDLNIDVETH